jgi:uncharacterized protein YjiS (DUF1127 family)
MKENLHREHGLSLHRRRPDDGSSAVVSLDAISCCLSPADRLRAPVWIVSARVDNLPAGQGSPLPTAPDVALPRRNETTVIAPLGPIGRSIATIRRWRRRVRSRQQLRELNDHILKDIGLSRDAVAYEVAKPFWH